MKGYFGIGVEGLSKPLNAGNLFRSAQAFGASFLFTVGASYAERAGRGGGAETPPLEMSRRALRGGGDTSHAPGRVPLYAFPDADAMVLPRGCALVGVELLDEAAGPRHPAVPQRRLDAREAREREPALPGDVTGAVWCPEDRFLDARGYTATVLRAAVLRGMHLMEGVRVTGLEWDGDRVIGVRAADRCWHAGTVINTAGAWAGGIDPRLTHPVYPDHGQIMAVQGPPRGLRHNLSRVGAEGYATPRPDGRVIFGATHELWGYQKKLTADGFAFLAATVDELLPALSDAPVLAIWSGLRPGTPDGLPTVGPDPRVRGGYLWGAGHASSGMQQMPATAQVLADLALQRPPRLPIQQLAIQRYLAT